MTHQTRSIGLVVGLLVAILLIIGWWFWDKMSQPLYTPGAIKGMTITPPPQKGDSTFWNMAEDIRLFHFSEGQGAKILTLHGGPGIPWEKPVRGFSLLSDQYQIHYYDQRGCGRSSKPFDRFASKDYFQNMTTLETKLGIQAQLEDIERIRQILGEDKLILVGHSFGGLLAVLYAAEYPENVKALVLIAPADLLKMPVDHGDLFETVRKDLPKAMQPAFDAWQKQYFDFGGIFKKSESELQALNQQFAEYYGEAVKARGLTLPDLPSAPSLTGGWATYAQYFSMGKKHDYRTAMDAVKIPVMVIHGANDLQSEAASRDFAANFSNAQFFSIAETGHFPFVEKPEVFATAVGKFLLEKTNR